MEEKKEDNEEYKENNLNLKDENINEEHNKNKDNNFNNKKTNTYFNIDKILYKCKNLNGFKLVSFIGQIMKEPKLKYLMMVFRALGKDYVLNKFEKALEIENNGGMNINKTNEKKTTGGIFFTLIKEEPEAKKILKDVSKEVKKLSKKHK